MTTEYNELTRRISDMASLIEANTKRGKFWTPRVIRSGRICGTELTKKCDLNEHNERRK